MRHLLWLTLLLRAAVGAAAPTVPGIWGSSDYRAELTVAGTTVSGTFTGPGGETGRLSGQLQGGGQAFTADWTSQVDGETRVFHTWLALRGQGALLSGVRWSDEGSPAAFGLHRAVGGQVPLWTDAATPNPTPPANAPTVVDLKGPGDSVTIRLPNGYPRTGLRFDLTVNYTAAGSILDTVGVNAAPLGAWALTVQPDGRICFSLFDPRTPSPARDASGWHRLRSRPVAAGTDHAVRVDRTATEIVLTVDGDAQRLALATPLSGQPVYLGDFPGDAQWPPPVVTKLGMTGRITVNGFGAWPPPGR